MSEQPFHVIRLNKHEQATVRLVYLNYLYHRAEWASNVLPRVAQSKRLGVDIGRINRSLIKNYHEMTQALPMPIDTILNKTPDRVWKFDAKKAFFLKHALVVYQSLGPTPELADYQKKMMQKILPSLSKRLDDAMRHEYTAEDLEKFKKGAK